MRRIDWLWWENFLFLSSLDYSTSSKSEENERKSRWEKNSNVWWQQLSRTAREKKKQTRWDLLFNALSFLFSHPWKTGDSELAKFIFSSGERLKKMSLSVDEKFFIWRILRKRKRKEEERKKISSFFYRSSRNFDMFDRWKQIRRTSSLLRRICVEIFHWKEKKENNQEGQ